MKGVAFLADAFAAIIVAVLLLYALAPPAALPSSRLIPLQDSATNTVALLYNNNTLDAVFDQSDGVASTALFNAISGVTPPTVGWSANVLVCSYVNFALSCTRNFTVSGPAFRTANVAVARQTFVRRVAPSPPYGLITLTEGYQ